MCFSHLHTVPVHVHVWEMVSAFNFLTFKLIKCVLKHTETYIPSIYLLCVSRFMGNIQMNLDVYVRVRAYEKRVTAKQP